MTPSTPYDRYLLLIDLLRDHRRAPDWTVDDDEPFIAEMMELHELLSEDEQRGVNTFGWRTLPEEYDARVRSTSGFDEVSDDALAHGELARRRAA